ncbi:hypothetical protein OG983_18715 [Streptomyces jietaisiensis]|uniref:hypothetical protein n=1 Tax=Streptomyces TaxID=1883 RepID=UPI001F42ADE3|nr:MULTISPECIES: hypothetical protein [Streptomyces]MCF0089608.1 hypothetical protein [Streptomyces sp. MH192]MCF0101622.1 hypothetical protein [Streptomyces sp. MH191]
MTNGAEGAGPGGEEADAWHERLGWVFGLIADDPTEREAALAHLDGARRNAWAALDRRNELWHITRPLGPEEQYQEPAFKRAREVYREMCSRTLPAGLWVGGGADGPLLPYALLFLEWEARFPRAWTEYAKAWGTKQSLIRRMAVADHDQPTRAKLIDLVEIAVRRTYRCKDREYVRVARAVDGGELRHRLGTAAVSDNPWARLHAGYVLWLLDRPEIPNTRHVWRTWVAEASRRQGGSSGPCG